jgi:uncharacterized delta-60 repeat protein
MKSLLIFSLILLLAVNNTTAQTGVLDPTFGTNGHVELGQHFTATAFGADGKLVGIRSEGPLLLVYQYDSNGTPDVSFGSAGVVVFNSLPEGAKAIDVAVGNDGKVVVLSSLPFILRNQSTQHRHAVVRFDKNGLPDPAFGINGVAINTFDTAAVWNITLHKVAVQNTGEIVVSFQSQIIGGTGFSRDHVAIYNAKGKLIFENHIGPFLLESLQYAYNKPTALFIQDDGKVLLGGTAYDPVIPVGPPARQYSTIRFNADATMDQSNNPTGFLILGSAFDSVKSLAVDSRTGAIFASGNANKLIKSPGGTFGSSGVATITFPANKILLQNDGKILAGGSLDADFALARYDSTGHLDVGFGNAGIVTSDFGDNEGISDMVVVGDHLYAYGSGKLAAYILTENPVFTIINSNTVAASQSFASNTTGAENTAIGGNALIANTTGTGNTSLGFNSMFTNSSGVYNTALGYAALAQNVGGTSNVAIGLAAGYSNSNYSSTFVGTLTNAAAPVYNSTALGFQAVVDESNQVRIGNAGVTSIGGFSNWTNLSDGHFKRNINEDVPGLAFITKLRPVTYTLDMDALDTKLKTDIRTGQGDALKGTNLTASPEELKAKNEKGAVKYTGFVAQEVEQAAKQLGYDFSGVDAPKNKDGYYGLRYAEFVMPLVKAIQEQQKQLKELNELLAKMSTTNNTNNTTITLSSAYLEQNFPNPNTGNTLIRYHLPEGAGNAQVVVTNMKGQVIRSVTLNSRGNGQITFNASTLAAGTYNYSLWISGKEVDTKRMVVVR